jgi:hypothetical protein
VAVGRAVIVSVGVGHAAPAHSGKDFVGVAGASVADISGSVSVGVGLVCVDNSRTVVAGVTHCVVVGVCLCRVRRAWAIVANIAHPIAIGITLIDVMRRGAVIRRAGIFGKSGIA